MPAGVTWGKYLKVTASALLSMFAGAQLVHMYYKPLQDLDHYIEMEMKKTMKEGVAMDANKNNP